MTTADFNKYNTNSIVEIDADPGLGFKGYSNLPGGRGWGSEAYEG